MSKSLNPFELLPTGYPPRIKFCAEEHGSDVAEVNVKSSLNGPEIRVRLVFGGAATIRIADYEDAEIKEKTNVPYILMKIENSEWLARDLEAYVRKFGSSILAVVKKDLQHFVLCGHEFNIGILARSVTCTVIDSVE